jgi:hypothetical protein
LGSAELVARDVLGQHRLAQYHQAAAAEALQNARADQRQEAMG